MMDSLNTRHQLPRVELWDDRQRFVLRRVAGKRTLHIGCTDRGFMEQRFAAGELLHQRLAAVASELWGMDLDREGIEFLRSRGVGNLLVGDATELEKIPELAGRRFEAIVAAEIIEHLSNVGLFLEGVKRLMIPGETEFIISVPNAFRLATLRALLRGEEEVHPDHVYWFSYRTITGLLKRHGFEIEEVATYSFSPAAGAVNGTGNIRRLLALPKTLLARLLFRITPFFGDGLLIAARLPR